MQFGKTIETVKVGSSVASPIAKFQLYATLVFFILLVIFYGYESIEKKSFVPLVYGTVGKVVLADQDIFEKVKLIKLAPEEITPFETNPSFAWYLKFVVWRKIFYWFNIISDLWFIYFLGWLLYLLYSGFNKSAVWQNLAKSFVTLIFIYMFVSVLFFILSYSGKTMPDFQTSSKQLGIQLIPFKGVISLGVFIKDVAVPKTPDMENDWFVRLFTYIPQQQVNMTNATGV